MRFQIWCSREIVRQMVFCVINLVINGMDKQTATCRDFEVSSGSSAIDKQLGKGFENCQGPCGRTRVSLLMDSKGEAHSMPCG